MPLRFPSCLIESATAETGLLHTAARWEAVKLGCKAWLSGLITPYTERPSVFSLLWAVIKVHAVVTYRTTARSNEPSPVAG